VTGILIRPLTKFAYRAVLYGGWRDGGRGLAKIALECAGDSLATVYRLRDGVANGASGFGLEPQLVGPVRVVGVALGRRGAARLSSWLEEAARSGADVALLGSPPPPECQIRHRALDRLGPGRLVRALDAENQLRPIDALLVAGRRERLALRLASRALRGVAPPLTPKDPSQKALDQLQRATRSV
jgi:hypothetical protein